MKFAFEIWFLDGFFDNKWIRYGSKEGGYRDHKTVMRFGF